MSVCDAGKCPAREVASRARPKEGWRDAMAEDKFVLPPLDTKFHCTNPDREMTLGQMLDGVDPDMWPTNEEMLETLLFCMDAE